jgi:hypothetical protein
VRFDGDHLPVWQEPSGCYLDPATGELLTDWNQALDAIGMDDDPMHVVQNGPQRKASGTVLPSWNWSLVPRL